MRYKFQVLSGGLTFFSSSSNSAFLGKPSLAVPDGCISVSSLNTSPTHTWYLTDLRHLLQLSNFNSLNHLLLKWKSEVRKDPAAVKMPSQADVFYSAGRYQGLILTSTPYLNGVQKNVSIDVCGSPGFPTDSFTIMWCNYRYCCCLWAILCCHYYF